MRRSKKIYLLILMVVFYSVLPYVSLQHSFANGEVKKQSNHEFLKIEAVAQTEKDITWKVSVNSVGQELPVQKLALHFSNGAASPVLVNADPNISIVSQADGKNEIRMPVSKGLQEITMKTDLLTPRPEAITAKGEMLVAEVTYEDKVTVAVQQKKEKEGQSPSEGHLLTKEEKPAGDGQSKVNEGSKQSENSHNGDATSSENIGVLADESKVNVETIERIAYDIPPISPLQVNSGSVSHSFGELSYENACLREVTGTIQFELPKTPTPIDIVIVQDASGSFQGNDTKVRNSLKQIADRLDFTKDRMMVTSYRGYAGYKIYNNETDYARQIIKETRPNNNAPKVTLSKHIGLSNNKDSIRSAIDKITFDGATPTASGLQYAKQQYQAETKGQNLSNRRTFFILMTDGVANARIDGYIHLNYRQWSQEFYPRTGLQLSEAVQFYQDTFTQVVNEAGSIKSNGYEVISAFWENTKILKDQYRYLYDNPVGPAAKQMVRDTASSPNHFATSTDINQLIDQMITNIENLTGNYNSFNMQFTVQEGFTLVPDSVKLNGTPVPYQQNGKTVSLRVSSTKIGQNVVTYKLQEQSVHSGSTIPVKNGTIQYGSENQSLAIPEATLQGNPNSANCTSVLQKRTAKLNSQDFKTSISLDRMDEVFQYQLRYRFDEKTGSYQKVQLRDQLEAILKVHGGTSQIQVVAPGISNFQATVNLLANDGGFTIDIPKRNNSYNYLASKEIVVTFQAKIRENTTVDEIKRYLQNGIPNKAELIINGETKPTNEVKVIPPTPGALKVTKVNEAGEVLAGAEFKLINMETGLQVAVGVSNNQGLVEFKDLLMGRYQLIETKAPTFVDANGVERSYRLLAEPKIVEITHAGHVVELRVENSKSDWEIPATGGVGSAIYQAIGILLMMMAGFYLVQMARRRSLK